MQLRVTDGTTTVDLSGGTTGVRGCTYFPAAGGSGEYSVTEQAEIIGSGTEAQIRSASRSVELLCDAARRRQALGLGTRVFVEYKPVDSDNLYRSELYDGRLLWSDEPGARRLGASAPVVKYAFAFERAPWWEGPETELALAVSGQAAATGGVTVTNNGTANWFQASTVEGSLPAPVRVQVTNATGSAATWREFFWGVNTFGNPATFQHYLQGEDQESGYGTDMASAQASGGYFNRVAVTTTGAWRNAWLLPTTMTAVGGRWFRLVVRAMVGSATTLKLRAGIYDVGGLNLLWQGQEVTWLGGEELIDLGAAPIPPGYVGSGSGQVMLKLWSEVSTGTYNLDIDYVALLSTDAWRRASTPGMSWGNGDAAVLDEIEGQAYGLSGATRYPYLLGHGGQLVVWPGQTNRFVQLVGNGTQTGSNTQAYSVRAWYRARRSTI
jgi:hypothetical protein